MNKLKEKYLLFLQSSFQHKKRNELFEFIWRNYSNKIFFYISNIIPRHYVGFEDVFQEVMTKIYKNLHTFNPVHSFKAWIYRIARNHCLDFIKSRHEKTLKLGDMNELNLPSNSDGPEKNMLRKELIEQIDKYLNSLDRFDREITFLRFYENLPYKDICRILNININTARSKIRLIRMDIKKSLKGVS